ncbi:hypothetical protein OIDMADRAFT_54847 [Oidiodendron maius Zn]|uniref:Rhodanese domain-containing protein n=1 Tax=Oidiodendron maius (strain Zn) TaxID=913774 RepID=A0A0C3CMN6_OIDMZ|nr:hypothetical protein OIDMADRAFT_54847 [Oidiodendron maius Zn]
MLLRVFEGPAGVRRAGLRCWRGREGSWARLSEGIGAVGRSRGVWIERAASRGKGVSEWKQRHERSSKSRGQRTQGDQQTNGLKEEKVVKGRRGGTKAKKKITNEEERNGRESTPESGDVLDVGLHERDVEPFAPPPHPGCEDARIPRCQDSTLPGFQRAVDTRAVPDTRSERSCFYGGGWDGWREEGPEDGELAARAKSGAMFTMGIR